MKVRNWTVAHPNLVEHFAFQQLTPCYAQRVLLIGALSVEPVWEGHVRELSQTTLSYLLSAGSLPPTPTYDFIVFDTPLSSTDVFSAALTSILPALSPQGMICLSAKSHAGNSHVILSERASERVAELGLLLYTWHPREVPSFPEGCALFLARSDYDPLLHAVQLAEAGRPDWSVRVLQNVPGEMFSTEEIRARVAAERLRYCGQIETVFGHPPNDFALLVQAQKDFYIAIYTLPELHAAYRNMAELWRRFGYEAMGARLLRSVLHAKNDPATRAMLETFSNARENHPYETTPVWTGTRRLPRILIITHDYSDYGMDTLYDGLCSVLGADHVVEFPWKPTLHGQRIETAANYPCVFDYPGEPRTVDTIVQELATGQYDIIVFGDVVQHAYRDEVRRMLQAAPNVPVVVYDTWDNPHNLRHTALEYLGRPDVAAYFKREMLAGCDYGENAFPLPFGYPDRLVPATLPETRTTDLFWAGKRIFGTRTLYLGYLERLLGRRFDTQYTQDEYGRVLDSARIGLSVFGFGFDTVRYWELAAHGCLLLAERPPIRIPFDFEEGVNAVFFDDLAEMESKLTYYLNHADETARLAAAGREHFLQYHTASARAEQFLGRLETLFAW